ncbi:ABC transporter ATP-binding protein [Kurthia massiliensis]|uniref:ABC transporter ATP-binding protein n=1 Tax=Kurthia massiliensis TaxID=1033739 RepID=UPI000289398E|nr:ABC transporter ATP-binding protein [Kurthia massiliensis]
MNIQDVTLSYDGTRNHLNDVSTTIPKGKITTIIGPNGSGKSTLLGVISRNYRPTTGHVTLEAKDIFDFKPKAFAKKLAIVYQHNTTPEQLTVEKLVAFGRVPHQHFMKRASVEDEEAIDWALSVTNLLEKRERPLTALSGGERQRVWIAMALAQQSDILCLDEPTTYLDIYYQLELLDLVKQLNATHGLTIVMVLHDMNQALRYSDNIIMMKSGEIVAEGAPQDVVTVESVYDVYQVQSRIYNDEQFGMMMMPVKI